MRLRLGTVIVCVVVAACGGDATGPGSTNKTVDIYTIGDAFSPFFESVAVGDTVRWNFSGGSDGAGHNVRFTTTPGAPANINVLKTGTASRVFTTKGDFLYDCDVHPGMRGEVIVK